MADAPPSNPFPAASEAEWRAAAIKALKGGDFERKLVTRSAGGLVIQPLYQRRHDAEPVAGARAGSRWGITARVDHPVAGEASSLALADLEGGADGLTLVFHGSRGARGFGLPTTDAATLAAALAGVSLDLVRIRLEPAPQARIACRLFAEVVKSQRLTPADLDIDFGIDPIGLLARSGVLLAPWADVGIRLGDMMGEFGGQGFRGPFFACDGRIAHEAGASEAQELAYVLASASAYMRALAGCGVPLAQAERALSFALAIDADQFAGIAKIRALRRLMAEVQRACGLDQAPVSIHAETAFRMLTRRDTPVNMLRNAIAAFAAGVGGADSVAVLPHTTALGLADGFARRVARNTQSVLMEESHLWRVVDPAAGSGALEALTDQICAQAWEAFQEIEREGGLVASLCGGHLQARIAAVRARRDGEMATGKAPLTGTSAYPDLGETPERVLDIAPVPARQAEGGSLSITPLPTARLSEPFEALRDRAAALAGSGRLKPVFLAGLGPASGYRPRADFARGLLAAGGLSAREPDTVAEADGGTDLMALTEAFKASGAALAVLCGSDESYAAEAADAAIALGASGAEAVWLAGRPGEHEARFLSAGVAGFIFTGCDMIVCLDAMLSLNEVRDDATA
jgi:methylmalonyl-CoA mutase